MGQRKKHPASLKVEVALATIKAELTQSQITSKYEIHTSQIAQWKKQAINSIKTSFTSQQSVMRDDVYYKQLTTKL